MQQIYDDGLIKKNDTGIYEVVGDETERKVLQAKRSKPKKRGNIEPLNYDNLSVDLDLQEGDIDLEEGDLEWKDISMSKSHGLLSVLLKSVFLNFRNWWASKTNQFLVTQGRRDIWDLKPFVREDGPKVADLTFFLKTSVTLKP